MVSAVVALPWRYEQDLVTDGGFRGGYQSVKRFVRKLRGNQPVQARAVILTAPGRKRRSITAPATWCAIRRAASIAAPGCLS